MCMLLRRRSLATVKSLLQHCRVAPIISSLLLPHLAWSIVGESGVIDSEKS